MERKKNGVKNWYHEECEKISEDKEKAKAPFSS